MEVLLGVLCFELGQKQRGERVIVSSSLVGTRECTDTGAVRKANDKEARAGTVNGAG